MAQQLTSESMSARSSGGSASRVSTGPAILRQINERAVFEEIRCRGDVGKAELSRSLGVSTTTIAKIISRLLDAGLIEDVGQSESGRAGRPGRIYRVAGAQTQVIGVVINVRRCQIFAAGLDGLPRTGTLDEFDTPGSYDQLITRLAAGVGRLVRNGARHTLGVGISAPGEIEARTGRVLLCPNLHILDATSPADDLEQRVDLPCVLVHETIGTCLAEYTYGAARDLEHFVLIGVYEGFGAAAICNGSLIVGERGMAMELGHVTVDLNGQRCGCGNRGCLETIATDQSFARLVNRRTRSDRTVEEIVRLAGLGQLNVDAELEQTLDALAVGVGTAVNIFNPGAVFVCSRMFDVRRDAFDYLLRRTAHHALPPLLSSCRILRAQGDVRLGAAASILTHLTDALGPAVR